MQVIIYSKTACPYCDMAKSYMQSHGISFQETVFDDLSDRQAMYDSLGLIGQERSVPQIFIVEDGEMKRIGGYSDLLRSDVADRIAIGDFNEEF